MRVLQDAAEPCAWGRVCAMWTSTILPCLPHAKWRGMGMLQVQVVDGHMEPVCAAVPCLALSGRSTLPRQRPTPPIENGQASCR